MSSSILSALYNGCQLLIHQNKTHIMLTAARQKHNANTAHLSTGIHAG